METKNFRKLKKKLDFHYGRYRKETVSPDPIEIPRLYSNKTDIELTAFVASVFAYGNVKQILKTLYAITDLLGNRPAQTLKRKSNLSDEIRLSQIKYRFYSNEDIVNLFELLRFVYKKYDSLENLFARGFDAKEKNVKTGIENFSREMLRICENKNCLTRGIKFMFPLPSKNSATKRMNLFLRWMVRKDEIDFGLWKNMPASTLVIPLDVHIGKIARKLGFTQRKSNDWKTAEEITDALKIFDAEDPVKYDFALCHIGMRKEKF